MPDRNPKPLASSAFFDVLQSMLNPVPEHRALGALAGYIDVTVPCPALVDHALYATCPLCRGTGVVGKA